MIGRMMKKAGRFFWALALAAIVFLCAFIAVCETSPVKTKEEAAGYLLDEVKAGKLEIRMEADAALIDFFSQTQNVYDVLSLSKIATAEWVVDDGALHLKNITAFPESVYCESMDDALKAFESRRDTVVLNLTEAFYEEFTGNDFYVFLQLDGIAGIESRDCEYYADTRIFVYENIKYAGKRGHIESVEELKAYIGECARNMEKEISYSLSDRMYDMAVINASIEQQILAANGVFTYSFYMTEEYKLRSVKDIVYYPGAKIIHAVKNNQLDTLTDEEKRLYEEAASICERVLAERKDEAHSEILLEKALVQEISKRCAYFVGEETSVYNTATGALLYGKADCDGQADALYLLGNLSGLTVYHQLGNTMDGGSHMWNLVCADGNWHFTDPTGCNMGLTERPEALNTDWMGMGLETALSRYIWNAVSQPAYVDSDDAGLKKEINEGNVFDSVLEARSYLKNNTDVWAQVVVKGVEENLAERTAEEVVYGYGGPYVHSLSGDWLYVTLLSTWFDFDYFYDCRTMQDVTDAFLQKKSNLILRLSEEMYADFLLDAGAALNAAETKAGIKEKQFSYYDTTRVFLYSDIQYE